jgi:hypothetical protein
MKRKQEGFTDAQMDRVYRAFFSVDELIDMHRKGETYPDGRPITLEDIELHRVDEAGRHKT